MDDLRAAFFRTKVRVKNSTGAVIPPYAVLRVVSVAIANGELVYTVAKPNSASTDFLWDYLVNGPMQIGAASTAEGWATALSEPGYVQYDSGSPALGQVWGPKHGQWGIASNYYGFQILGGGSAIAGNNVIVARQVGVHYVLGKIDDSTVNKGSTCTVSVWDQGRSADTTMNITSVMNNAVNLTSINGKKCGVCRAGSAAELCWVECS